MTLQRVWNADRILDLLNAHAQRFEFPVLDNVHWNYLGGRLRGFRKGPEWALTFELFIFNVPASCFCIQVYGYGPLIRSRPPDVGVVEVVSECDDDRLWDNDGIWRPWTGRRDVVVAGQLLRIATSAEEPHDLILSAGDAESELTFGVALARELGLAILFGDDPLRRIGVELPASAEAFRLASWDHPDIAAGADVHDSKALRAVAAALSSESSAPHFNHEHDNSDWRFWCSRSG